MRRILLLIFCIGLMMLESMAQKIPNDIQEILNRLKDESRIALDDYRVNSGKGELHSGLLMYYFSYPPSLQQRVDSLNLKLNLGMIYDEEMRVRIIQLMNNEFNEAELDTLVDRKINLNLFGYQNEAYDLCKFDTIQLFKNKLDSFYLDLKLKNTKDLQYKFTYQYDVFRLMQLDTTTVFMTNYNKVIKNDSIRIRNEYLVSTNYNYTYIAELCGYINDKRFIKPLINALKKPGNFDSVKVIESLVRMKVEPYYKNYIKSRTRSLNQIKKGEFDFEIKDFVFVLNTQESFLELSKYLLSDTPYLFFSDDTSLPVSYEATSLIKDFIENEDIQQLVKTDSYTKDNLLKIYNWMQKNYRKYKIRRIW